ncbi:MAG: hypothetical protein A2Y97_02405 [Nitrospirae bacterium RBG_13_39_12]|nr:MAG: hypothetical protein A2Y97_02405 [Nitrospirae bacterium RBG_13_39_12]
MIHDQAKILDFFSKKKRHFYPKHGVADMNEELNFWDTELSLKGKFGEFTKKRIDPKQRKEEFPTLIFDAVLPLLDEHFGASGRPFKCVELGSGPLSNLAYGVDAGLIDVTAVDILAEGYGHLYEKYNLLDYPVKPISGSGEVLTDLFEGETFHCAYARNSLDHTQDILLSFKNLVSLVKRNGYIILQHFVREGSRSDWNNTHQWDLELTANGFVAFNSKGEEFQLQKGCNVEFSYVFYRSVEIDRWMDIVLKKV